jgi:hypothetical protein
MKTIFIPIEILIPASIQVLEPNIAALTISQAEPYVKQLFEGLNIPAKAKISVEVNSEPTDDWFALRIANQRARVRFYQGLSEQFLQTLPIGAGICEEIGRNRSLLATPEVLEYTATLAPGYFRQFSIDDQQKVVSTLFHLGFGLERLKKFPELVDDAPEPLMFLETCIGDLEVTSATMYAHSSEIEDDDDPNDFNRLVEALQLATNEIFKQTGVPVPRIKTSIKPELSPGEFYFRFNDFYLPKRTIHGVQEQFLYLLAQLKDFGQLFINRGSVQFLLESLETTNPNLLAVFRAKFPTETLVQVLRQLAQERISIRAIVRMLEIMVGGDDTYVVPVQKWFPTPISENILFLGEAKAWSNLSTSDWADFVRMYYKSGLRNLAINFAHQTEVNLVRGVAGVNLHDYCQRLAISEGETRTDLLQKLHQELAYMVLDSIQRNERWFCINALASYRSQLQEAIRYEFPEIAVFSNQELLLINLTADQCYSLSL